ncbi:LamG domain-containing protein [Candidatus Woesearchaeota archaeon]|nr:LamG domain-containing protein [Candidatus Woesearchaeota archaeon]
MDNRGQAAFEFLATYAWVLVIIVIVAIVFFSIGLFNPSTYQGNMCSGFEKLAYQDHVYDGNTFELVLLNGEGQAINITDVNVTLNDGSTGSSSSPLFVVPTGEGRIIVPVSGPFGQYTADVTVTYSTLGTNLQKKVTGVCTGVAGLPYATAAATGTLGVSLTSPHSHFVVGDTFNTVATITCSGGICGTVSAYPEWCTGISCTGWSNMTSSSNVQTSDTIPYSCGAMNDTDTCNVGFSTTTAATGDYRVNIRADSSESGVTSQRATTLPEVEISAVGTLSVNVTAPLNNADISNGVPFGVNATISCSGISGAYCDDVDGYLQYCSGTGCTSWANMTGSGNLSTSSTNPYACGQMSAGENCYATFTATGNNNGTYRVNVFANSASGVVTDVRDSTPPEIDIVSAGTLTVNLSAPTNGASILNGTTFDLNGTVNCTGGTGTTCGGVDAYAEYCSGASCTAWGNMSGSGNLSTSDTNPDTGCGVMDANSTCDVSWLVTANNSGTYRLNTYADSNNTSVTDVRDSTPPQITVTSPTTQYTATYPFTTPSNYTYTATDIAVLGGVAKLVRGGAYTSDGSTVGLWHFEEGTGTNALDSAGSDNNGTLVNGPTWTTNSAVGNYAVDLDGTNDRIDTTYTSAMNTTGAFTIEGWINADNVTGTKTLFSRGISTGGLSYRVDLVGLRIRFYIYSNGTSNRTTTTGNVIMSAGTWYHVAAVYSPSSYMRIYVNGVQRANRTNGIYSSLFSTTQPLLIGALKTTTSWSNYFGGLMDEVRLSNTARTTFNTNRNYPTSGPSIRPVSPITAASVVSWNSFTETSTLNGQTIDYQLSDNSGTTWYYWNGSSWASTTTSWNSASVVNSNISFFSTANNSLLFRARLNSSGSATPLLDNIDINYTA